MAIKNLHPNKKFQAHSVIKLKNRNFEIRETFKTLSSFSSDGLPVSFEIVKLFELCDRFQVTPLWKIRISLKSFRRTL